MRSIRHHFNNSTEAASAIVSSTSAACSKCLPPSAIPCQFTNNSAERAMLSRLLFFASDNLNLTSGQFRDDISEVLRAAKDYHLENVIKQNAKSS